MKPQVIKNAKGEKILLNSKEQRLADFLQGEIDRKYKNTLGYEINITTLTTIMKKISQQKFFQIAPADYLPVRVGEGAWSTNLVTYREFSIADDFATGVVNQGGNNARLANADAGVDSLPILVKNWAKGIGWNIMELQQAAKAGNWDLVTAKERSRKKNWDLGIQKVAFLGLAGDAGVLGLLNQAGITHDTVTLTTPISTMTVTQLKAFLAAIIGAYRNNCNHTTYPTHFIIPESDFTGLASQASADFPIKSTLQVLEEAFQTVCMNKNFKILPLAYANKAISGFGVDRYTLLNYEEESIRMDIPVDYTNTLANSLDNFSFQNVGYGQFTGVLAYRPKELYYLDF